MVMPLSTALPDSGHLIAGGRCLSTCRDITFPAAERFAGFNWTAGNDERGVSVDILAQPISYAETLPLFFLFLLGGNRLFTLLNITAGIVNIDTFFFHISQGFLAACKTADHNSV